MREGWTYKKLGEVVQVMNGFAFKSNLYVDKGIRVMRITNVQKGNTVDDDPKFYPSTAENEIKNYLLEENDLLMSLTGNVGRVGLLQKNMLPAALNQRVACLRTKTKDLSLPFLFHLLNSDMFEKEAILSSKGIAQKNMSTEWLKDYFIPLPPKSQQEAIVSELDEINSLLALKREQLQKYDKLAQSLFYEMFGDPVENEKGWEVKKFGEVGTFTRCNGIVKNDFVEQGKPCIHYGQIHTKFGPSIYSHLTEISEKLFDKSKKASTGDIIIAITSEDIEGSCKCTAWLGNYDIAVGAHAAIFKHNQNPLFVSYYFKSNAFFAEKSKYARGFKVMEIKPSDIEKIPIYLPPLTLQQQFASRIEQIELQKQQVQAAIEKLETLLASRMQYWFE